MTPMPAEPSAPTTQATWGHGVNNLLAKIMGSAELALDQSQQPNVRAELEIILDLAEAVAREVSALPQPDPAASETAPAAGAAHPAQALLDAMDGVSYVVAPDGLILAIGGPAWDAFARANDGLGTTAADTIGRSLFDVLSGEEVAAVYRAIHLAVATGKRSYVAFEYRCDAPDTRRRMRMSVGPLRMAGQPLSLLYQSQVLSAVARPWMSLFEPGRIVDSIRAESDLPIVRLCSFCHRLAPDANPDNPAPWAEPDAYYRDGGSPDVRVSHGVCPACAADVS